MGLVNTLGISGRVLRTAPVLAFRLNVGSTNGADTSSSARGTMTISCRKSHDQTQSAKSGSVLMRP